MENSNSNNQSECVTKQNLLLIFHSHKHELYSNIYVHMAL